MRRRKTDKGECVRKRIAATTIATMLVIGAVSFLATLQAQPAARDQLLLSVAQGDSTLSIVRVAGQALTLIKTLPIGTDTREVCVAPDGRRAYVSNDGEGSVTAIDLDAQTVVATIALPGIKRPEGCVVSPDLTTLNVAGMESDNVAIVSTKTNQLVKTVEAGCAWASGGQRLRTSVLLAGRGRPLSVVESGGALREHSFRTGEEEIALDFFTGPVQV
jgi:YVTN family beta-propeller protein